VSNSTAGVILEVEGPSVATNEFLLRVERDKPPHARIHGLEPSWLDPAGYSTFEIRESQLSSGMTALVMPDIATCADCLREVFDSSNRRFRYPFTNCTHCGPRFSIIKAVPYDRASTSMASFTMCPECEREYRDPADRRFHAQPNACPNCGPQLTLCDADGRELATADEALRRCADAIRGGEIVAVKGIGGFHLMVDACNNEAVLRLRARKHRDEKPLALMFPSLEAVRACCEVSNLETRLLESPEAAIVLLRSLPGGDLAPAIAPRNPHLGVLLPYTPMHHLLLAAIGGPVVATSGNLSDEPICTDNDDALRRLRGIADLFLVHDRPIVRHVDDSVVRVMLDRELVLRRARGYAPLPLSANATFEVPTLGVGALLKNAVALGVGRQVFVSQHIGDLETEAAMHAMESVAADMQRLFQAKAQRVATDEHPDYASTRWAGHLGLAIVKVQHHYAHALACMAENEVSAPALAVTWDGTGYGPDGTVWGGEFLRLDDKGFERVCAFLPFPLPGGDAAAREPRRSALGVLYRCEGEAAFDRPEISRNATFSSAELETLRRMLTRGLNSPLTSSAGRLFDTVASLLGLRQRSSHEGQAAMDLEFAAHGCVTEAVYPFDIVASPQSGAPYTPRWHIDWRPMLRAILSDLAHSPAGEISATFHNTLAAMIGAVAERCGERQVVLSGGCFQNRSLAERTIHRLRAQGHQLYWHQRIPPNDGGIAVGQVIATLHSSPSRGDKVGPFAPRGL
jgi:hydrogenase maturation protein HypF